MGVQWGFDDKLTFLEVESDASEAGSSSFEYLTSAECFIYISMRRCNPNALEDVRIFSTEEQGRGMETTILCFRSSLPPGSLESCHYRGGSSPYYLYQYLLSSLLRRMERKRPSRASSASSNKATPITGQF